jgi:hypothetical protein
MTPSQTPRAMRSVALHPTLRPRVLSHLTPPPLPLLPSPHLCSCLKSAARLVLITKSTSTMATNGVPAPSNAALRSELMGRNAPSHGALMGAKEAYPYQWPDTRNGC